MCMLPACKSSHLTKGFSRLNKIPIQSTPHPNCCHTSPHTLTVVTLHPSSSLSSHFTPHPHCRHTSPLTLTVVTLHPSSSLLSHFTPHHHCCHTSPLILTVVTLHPSSSLLSHFTPHHHCCHTSPLTLTQLMTTTSGLADDHEHRLVSSPSESLRLLLWRAGVLTWPERLLL